MMEKNQIFENIMSRTSVRSYTDMPPLAIVVCGCLDKTLEGTEQEFWIQDCSAHGEHPADGSRLGTWRGMDSPLSPERTIRGNAATTASAQDEDSAQHPHHRISEESGGSKG